MPEAFVPLAAYLRGPGEASPDPIDDRGVGEELAQTEVVDAAVGVEDGMECGERDDALAEVRRFRAALADALEVALCDLLRDLAAGVLARELRLAPVDLATIAATALARYRDAEPLLLRVHPEELDRLAACDVAAVADERLRRGDLLIELREGTIDATLGARLAQLLAHRGLA